MADMLPVGTVVALTGDKLWALESGSTVDVMCEQGSIWITQRAEPRDIVVTAGQTIRLAVSGLTLLAGLDPVTRVRLEDGEAWRQAA